MEREIEAYQLRQMIENVIEQKFDEYGLKRNQFRYGKVESVISPNSLRVFIDGSDVPITVQCDPDKTFSIGDEVLIIEINKTTRFVISKRF